MTGASAFDELEAVLGAFLAVGDDLDLPTTLQHIVEAAADLVDAQYGALGVLGDDGSLADFVYVGIDEATRAQLPAQPTGHSLVGLLLKHPQVIRLADLTSHPASVGFPPGHPIMRTFIGAPIRVGDTTFGHLYLTEKRGGGPFSERDEKFLLALAAAAGSAVHTARLVTELRRRERWLLALAAVRNELMVGESVDATLDLVADRVNALVEAESTAVILPSPDGHGVVRAAAGLAITTDLAAPIDPDDPAWAALVDEIGSVDGGELPRSTHPGLAALLDGGPVMVAPVPVPGGRGVVVCARPTGAAPFRADQQPELVGLAEQASLAIDLADRQQQRRRLELVADRERIARDLHDHVIQRLFGIGLSLQGMATSLTEPVHQSRLEENVNQIDEAIRDLRSSIYDLRSDPDSLKPGLRHRILDIIAKANEAGSVAVTARISGPVDTLVPPDIAEHAVAVVREGVSNAVRHSGGTAVTVSVAVTSGDDAGVCIDVADDGRGMSSDGAHSGLRNLAERAQTCGGEFAVTGGESGGTRLHWRAPFPAEPGT